MTISYKWLSEYLPQTIEPEVLSHILTSIGLEVESLEAYETVKGNLKGLVVGEVLTCTQHPNADKLKLTTVDTGNGSRLHIVCGAPNVAEGQKVIVAPVGTTIYPTGREPLTMKEAKIRGEISQGMICAEDEIGMGTSHAGIMILPAGIAAGTPAADFFTPYHDYIYEIGLTPNRMDAMSHLGVARDVCAYLSHHQQKPVLPVVPFKEGFAADNNSTPIWVTVENTAGCPRYSGISLSNLSVKESPDWLQNKLKAIGVRPINNIVDITNFILHETGQPLHAFDADAITGNHVIVKTLPAGTPFVSLDEKERKLNNTDLMICNEEGGMCIAGVFGGMASGVTENTTRIFLESACFDSTYIRRTSLAHNLRTDAATRFEKGTDISATVKVLKRAALLIKEVAGGTISSDIIDINSNPQPRKQVTLSFSYLTKLSGKHYEPTVVRNILQSLQFEVISETANHITVAVPYSKPDIGLPADIVEEIVRIDGLDNILIPTTISLSPARETLGFAEAFKEKISQQLAGLGFYEIVTNSITNSKFYGEDTLQKSVLMLNNLSADLDVLRPSMLQTGLETIVYNLNRKNSNLQLFEWGKTYHKKESGSYYETDHLALYITGAAQEDYWNKQSTPFDIYTLKGYVQAIGAMAGLPPFRFGADEAFSQSLNIYSGKQKTGTLRRVEAAEAKEFDIKQPVFFADIFVQTLMEAAAQTKITYKEITRFPSVHRDLAMVINKDVKFADIEETIARLKLSRLSGVRLFDKFESEKLGMGKMSLAISFTFTDEEKTLTDKEIDGMMARIMQSLTTNLSAEIRK